MDTTTIIGIHGTYVCGLDKMCTFEPSTTSVPVPTCSVVTMTDGQADARGNIHHSTATATCTHQSPSAATCDIQFISATDHQNFVQTRPLQLDKTLLLSSCGAD